MNDQPGRAAGRGRAGQTFVTGELLARRYLLQHATADQIAAETGWSGQYIRDRLRQHGIALRPVGVTKPQPLTAADLTRWLAGGWSVARVAAHTGYSPSGVYQHLRRLQLPMPGTAPTLTQPGELAELTRRYVQDQQSLRAIGRAYGRGPDWVRGRLVAADVPLRRPGRRSPADPTARVAPDGEELARRYTAGFTVQELADRTGSTTLAVSAALRAAGIRPRLGRPPARPAPDPEQLRALYTQQRRTLAQVAEQLGCSSEQVRAGLLAAGVALRPARHPARADVLPPITAQQLRELYQDQQLTLDEIAERLGGSPTRVSAALTRHQIPRRPRAARRPPPDIELDRDTLHRLYVQQRLDDTTIADRHDVPTWRITRRRRQLHVTRPPTPPPHPTPAQPPAPGELRALYLDQQLSIAQIARHYRTGNPTARSWLHDAGIALRPRTARSHRTTLNLDQLQQLYTARQWSAAQIAAHLGTTVHLVLRTLHDAGIPVRRGGTPRSRTASTSTGTGTADPPAAQLLADLYADRDITAVLRLHHLPRRTRPGPIAQRFPTAVPLSTALLAALYHDVGLSARQIELLTGQPHEQILAALHHAGLQVRTDAGPSPWSTRRS